MILRVTAHLQYRRGRSTPPDNTVRQINDHTTIDFASFRTREIARVIALAIATAAATAAAGQAAVSIPTAIVGPTSTVAASKVVQAQAFTTTVAGKRCKVAANTPLAALHARAVRAGVRARIRDYGECGQGVGSSSMLFVYKIGPYKNKGQDGWVYEVSGKLGTAGAADLDGPFGKGLLTSNQKLVWRYCYLKKGGGGCR